MVMVNAVLNLISLTRSSLQILGKAQTRYFRFLDLWSIPYRQKLP